MEGEYKDCRDGVAEERSGEDGVRGGEGDGVVGGAEGGRKEGGEEVVEGYDDADASELVGEAEEEGAA